MGRTINTLPNEMLLEIFSLCSVEDLVLRIQYVNRHWNELIQDSKMWKRLSFCPNPRKTRKSVTKILVHAPLLQSLVLMEHVDNLMVNIICSCCPSIKTLEFYDINPVTVEMLVKIGKYLPNLQTLTLRSMDIKSSSFAGALGQFHNLKKLTLLHTFYMGAELIKSITDGCESLEHLNLGGIDVNDTMIQYFIKKKGPQLKSLLLDRVRLSSAALTHIKNCSKLENFVFHDCTSLTEKVFLDIAALPNICCLQLPQA